jgi:isoaspartyl peptidase/L-asparaginase-like protein (Ntn-hydrolase superfamily)
MIPALIAHGGAGADPDDRGSYRDSLRAALAADWARVLAGASALDAVEACVAAMEDDPRFKIAEDLGIHLAEDSGGWSRA